MADLPFVDLLSQLHCFRSVPRNALSALAEVCEVRTYEIRDAVLTQGSSTDIALLLVEGMLEVSVQARQTWHHIATIQPGEVVGESALFMQDISRNATVLAHKPSRCLVLSPDAVTRLAGNPALMALELSIVASLSRRIRKTNLEIQSAWKDTHPPTPPTASGKAKTADKGSKATETGKPEAPRTFAGRLRTMFKGRGGKP